MSDRDPGEPAPGRGRAPHRAPVPRPPARHPAARLATAVAAIAAALWQLPQLAAGLVLRAIVHRRVVRVAARDRCRVFYCFTRYGGVSLGSLLFVHRDSDERLVRHELGHAAQSRLLGPFYLLVVGLPSIAWAALFGLAFRSRQPGDYFRFYTERWADRLGGVSR